MGLLFVERECEKKQKNAKWPARKINNKSRLVADRGNLSSIFITTI